jgi:hypothetical protein
VPDPVEDVPASPPAPPWGPLLLEGASLRSPQLSAAKSAKDPAAREAVYRPIMCVDLPSLGALES